MLRKKFKILNANSRKEKEKTYNQQSQFLPTKTGKIEKLTKSGQEEINRRQEIKKNKNSKKNQQTRKQTVEKIRKVKLVL